MYSETVTTGVKLIRIKDLLRKSQQLNRIFNVQIFVREFHIQQKPQQQQQQEFAQQISVNCE